MRTAFDFAEMKTGLRRRRFYAAVNSAAIRRCRLNAPLQSKATLKLRCVHARHLWPIFGVLLGQKVPTFSFKAQHYEHIM